MTRSNSSPIVSPPRNGLSFGTTPRNACTNACSSSRRRDRREPVAAELLQLRPDLRRPARGDELRRLHRPRQPARDHAVERDPREQPARRLGLGSALVGQRHRLGRHGAARVVEVGHGAVAHEVDPAARSLRSSGSGPGSRGLRSRVAPRPPPAAAWRSPGRMSPARIRRAVCPVRLRRPGCLPLDDREGVHRDERAKPEPMVGRARAGSRPRGTRAPRSRARPRSGGRCSCRLLDQVEELELHLRREAAEDRELDAALLAGGGGGTG